MVSLMKFLSFWFVSFTTGSFYEETRKRNVGSRRSFLTMDEMEIDDCY